MKKITNGIIWVSNSRRRVKLRQKILPKIATKVISKCNKEK